MNNNYTKTHDIDWFYSISGYPIHVASAGGRLPKGIRNLGMLRKLQIAIDALPERFDVELNRDYIRNTIIEKEYSYFTPDLFPENNDFDNNLGKYNLNFEETMYYNTFIYFALRGFYSFDRNLSEDKDEVYFWVARPKIDTDEVIRDLTKTLIDIGLPTVQTDRVKFDFNYEQLINIPIIEIIDRKN